MEARWLTRLAARRVVLEVKRPYDAGLLLSYLAAKAVPGVESVGATSYARTLRHPSGSGSLAVDFSRTDEGCVTFVTDVPDQAGVAELVAALVDSAAEPARIASKLAADPMLCPLVQRWPGVRVPGTVDVFELGVRTILGQQISVKAAARLAGRIVERHGDTAAGSVLGSEARIFPPAEVLTRADLTELGVPATRARAISGLATLSLQGALHVTTLHSKAEVGRRLRALPGVGDWTASYIQLRGLGDADAMPVSDAGLQSAAAEALGEDLTPQRLESRSDAWRPWRGYAAVYLWSTFLTAKAASVRADGE